MRFEAFSLRLSVSDLRGLNYFCTGYEEKGDGFCMCFSGLNGRL